MSAIIEVTSDVDLIQKLMNGSERKSFADLEKNYKKLIQKIGPENARSLKKHLDRLKASVCFQSFLDLGLGKPHSLSANLIGYYAISLTGNYRLIVEPLCDGRDYASLKNCTSVMVKGVGDYHGGKIEWIIP